MLSLTRITLTKSDLNTYDNVIPANLVIASRTANNIIAQAQKTAIDITTKAEQDYQTRYAQGYSDGQKTWELKKVDDVTRLNIDIKQHITGLHEKLTDTVLQITQKLLGNFSQEELMNGLVNQAINQLSTECILNLRISPENADTAKKVTQEILANNPTIEGFNIIVDPRLSELDCLLEHPNGTHDISANTQLKNLSGMLK